MGSKLASAGDGHSYADSGGDPEHNQITHVIFMFQTPHHLPTFF